MMTLADRLRRYSQGKDTAMGNDLIKAADQIERLEKAIRGHKAIHGYPCDPKVKAEADLMLWSMLLISGFFQPVVVIANIFLVIFTLLSLIINFLCPFVCG